MLHCHRASALRSGGRCDQPRDPRVRQMEEFKKHREAGLWSGSKRIQIKEVPEPPSGGVPLDQTFR